jgi:putative peptidoglycan lipid II flippase
VEFTLLRRTLNRRIGRTGLPYAFLAKLWIAAGVAAAAGWAAHHFLGHRAPNPGTLHREILAVIVLGIYGVLYFAMTFALGLPEARALVERTIGMLRPDARRAP